MIARDLEQKLTKRERLGPYVGFTGEEVFDCKHCLDHELCLIVKAKRTR